jgi:hypothetical protein
LEKGARKDDELLALNDDAACVGETWTMDASVVGADVADDEEHGAPAQSMSAA